MTQHQQQPDLDRIEATLAIATTEAADAELPHGIAALVDDAAALVAEVRRLRTELATARSDTFREAAAHVSECCAIRLRRLAEETPAAPAARSAAV